MATRRTLLKSGMGAGAALALGASGFRFARAQGTSDQAARNKAIVRRFKEAQRTPDYEQVLRETQSPDYRRLRAGFENLGTNARGSELAEMAQPMGAAIPDREDKVDHVFAEGDKVWIQFRLHGTNTRSLFGLPPTNEIVEMAEVGIMTFDGSRWATGWFFGDDLGMALQLGHPEIFG